jgi:hypothetical protein
LCSSFGAPRSPVAQLTCSPQLQQPPAQRRVRVPHQLPPELPRQICRLDASVAAGQLPASYQPPHNHVQVKCHLAKMLPYCQHCWPKVHRPAGQALALSAMSSTHTPMPGQPTGTKRHALAGTCSQPQQAGSRTALGTSIAGACQPAGADLSQNAVMPQVHCLLDQRLLFSAHPAHASTPLPAHGDVPPVKIYSCLIVQRQLPSCQLPSHRPPPPPPPHHYRGCTGIVNHCAAPSYEVLFAGQAMHKPQRPECMPQRSVHELQGTTSTSYSAVSASALSCSRRLPSAV